jgi:two-component system LytT family sensor kinase
VKKKNVILLHLAFWVTTIVATFLTTVPDFEKYPFIYVVSGYSVYLVSFIAMFYLFYSFISVKHLDKRRMPILICGGFIFAVIATVPATFVYTYIVVGKVFTLKGKDSLLAFGSYYFPILETNVLFITAGALLKIALLWYENAIKQKEIEKQLIENELSFLKAQINPLFLLNTLNNIKSLIKRVPLKAIYCIEKLSEIMSYMLYESSGEKVFLANEINCLKDYLDLQKVRYGDSGAINFQVTGKYDALMVPPLIFMPFLENAFKYAETYSDKPKMKVNFDVKNTNLTFEVLNYAAGDRTPQAAAYGMSFNVFRRRFDLLFQSRYKLEVLSENNLYRVILNISF